MMSDDAKPFANPILRVEWLDSLLMDRWVREEDPDPDVSPLVTVGFLMYENDRVLAIARETQCNGVWRGIIVIPKFAITKRTALRTRG